jgi:hypothetical protein
MPRETTGLLFVAFFLAATISSASAQKNQNNPNDPTFGNRSEKPDGSVALTIGRRLPTEWDTRFGMDANMPAEPPSALVDAGLVDPSITRSSGAVWGSMTGPGVAPIIFDKTSVDARIDPSQEKGQVAATLSRTLPLNGDVSVTLQDKYSLTQSLPGNSVTLQPSSGAIWQADRSLRLNLAPTSTTLSAGVVTSNIDNEWHNKLSAEQRIIGPLNVTTSITDPGTGASSKSIAAGFKHTW